METIKKKILKKTLSLLLSSAFCISAFLSVYAKEIPEDETIKSETVVASNVCASQNQINIVARGDYMYNITWVAQQTVTGWGGTFYQGNTYHIPYGQPIYSGEYIGYGATVEEFINAAATAGSVFYTVKSYYTGPTAPYYVTDCSSFVSWTWGIDRTTTYFIPDVATSFGAVTTASATTGLQLGDALNSTEHVVLVTGLDYDSSGNITRIEITEQTPPQMKRSYYTPAQLYSKYYDYTIYRYQGTVPSAPTSNYWVADAAFDVMVYRDRNSDLAHLSDDELKAHWLEKGISEGRASSPVLDLKYYLENNPDLKEAFGKDYTLVYNHFINNGYKEKRKSSRLFDGEYYCENNPNILSEYGDDYMRHYMEIGIKEGKRASLTFDADYYWHIRPDVYNAWPGNYEMCAKHYAGHGIVAGEVAYDSVQPVISNVRVTNVSSKGYTVTCTVTDNWGIEFVSFPTWTVYNDQDDLEDYFFETQRGTKNGDTYTFVVKSSEHNYETGLYTTHIYAMDKGENLISVSLDNVNVKDPSANKITLLSTSEYFTEDAILLGVEEKTTVKLLLEHFESDNLKVVSSNGTLFNNNSFMGTGAKILLYNGNVVVDSLTVVILGDVDGTGIIDSTDYARIKAVFLNIFSLNEAQYIAADVDKNSAIDSTDYIKLKSRFL